jgi:hypothetical protein
VIGRDADRVVFPGHEFDMHPKAVESEGVRILADDIRDHAPVIP